MGPSFKDPPICWAMLGPKVDMAETVAAVGTVTVVTETVTVDQGALCWENHLGKSSYWGFFQ